MKFDLTLFEAFCRTSYQIEAPGGSLTVRIGEPNSALDERLAGANAARWAIIIADNPHAQTSSPEDNEQRRAMLTKFATKRGFATWPTKTIADDNGWPEERGLCFLNMTRREALQLGIEAEQCAIVYGEVRRPPAVPGLLFSNHEEALPVMEAARRSDDPQISAAAEASLAEAALVIGTD